MVKIDKCMFGMDRGKEKKTRINRIENCEDHGCRISLTEEDWGLACLTLIIDVN